MLWKVWYFVSDWSDEKKYRGCEEQVNKWRQVTICSDIVLGLIWPHVKNDRIDDNSIYMCWTYLHVQTPFEYSISLYR